MAGPIRPNRAKLHPQRGQIAIRGIIIGLHEVKPNGKLGQRDMDTSTQETTAQLETRIDNALERIKAQAGHAKALQSKLDSLQSARDKDIAELDALVAELKPLVEED